MATKIKKPPRGHAGASQRFTVTASDREYSPTGTPRLARALRANLARAREPALRERLAAAIASLENAVRS